MGACLSRTNATWIAQVWPGQATEGMTRRFILDHCFDFVTLPCPAERLAFALGHAHGLSMLRETEVATPRDSGRHGMIGESAAMLQLYRGIDRCARTEAPVFIAGESGTGKELTAWAIHKASPRARKAYVTINCAAVPPSLLQSELFGHERGAFTGALQKKIGRIEAAAGGTLFLDEIGDLPFDCQAVLLRFLQEGTVERVGGNGPIRVDARIISATHVNLDAAVEAGRFRADLYHRLCVLRLAEPPLRERGNDVKLLADHALAKYKQEGPRKIRGFSDDAVEAMLGHDWPGNVRELINRVRCALVMAEGKLLTPRDLELESPAESKTATLGQRREMAALSAIETVLSDPNHRLGHRAADIGMPGHTLSRLWVEHGMSNTAGTVASDDRDAARQLDQEASA